jgi:quinoprotein glucose dehydrogenase
MTKGTRLRRVEGGNSAQQGFALFMRNCVGCHGADRTGITAPRELGMAHFVSTLRQGKEQMPAFSEDTLSAKDVEELAAYLNDPAAGEIPVAGEPDDASDVLPGSGSERYYGPFGAQMLAENGYSALGPPWTLLVAYDLNEGTIKWRIPLGTTPGLAAKGITDSGSLRARNGPVVTAGGLIFVATSPDRMIRAYDKDTGKTLWETEIEANPDGIPAVYEVNGRQYVAFFAAAKYGRESPAAKQGKPEAQGYYVFALPAETPNPRKQ